MKKIFLILIFSVLALSCSSEDSNPAVVTTNYQGTFKAVSFEYRGKTISVSDCQGNSKIIINEDKSGVYESYEYNSTIGSCAATESLTGTWQVTNNKLVLSKNHQLVKSLDLESISSTEIKVIDNSHNVDALPGNDEAVLSFVKIQ